MLITEISDQIKKEIQYKLSKKPHTTNGWSMHGSCCSQQALNIMYRSDFTGYGVTIPGTSYHLWIHEEILPSGTVLKNENGQDEWEIIGHEQYVYYHDGHVLRKSAIDTVVYDIITNEFELWDQKSSGSSLKYVQTPLRYRAQINFNARQFKEALRLEYNPILRLIYVNKRDWLDMKDKPFRYDPELGEWSIANMKRVYEIVENFNESILRWKELIKDALNDWSTTSEPYRNDCKYCTRKKICLSCLGFQYTVENEKKLVYGGIP